MYVEGIHVHRVSVMSARARKSPKAELVNSHEVGPWLGCRARCNHSVGSDAVWSAG